MRRHVRFAGVILVSLVLAAPEKSCCIYSNEIEIEITQQPEGGENVSSLTCSFNGTFFWVDEDKKEMELEAVWMTESGAHKTDTFTFTQDNDSQQLTTTFSAPAGMYLDKTFWVEFIAEQIVGPWESDKAECTVPGG